MPDPVSIDEIEDVLSSIRRLISGDEPQSGGAKAPATGVDRSANDVEEGRLILAASQDVTPAAMPDRLVLTQALRVPAEEGADPSSARNDADRPVLELLSSQLAEQASVSVSEGEEAGSEGEDAEAKADAPASKDADSDAQQPGAVSILAQLVEQELNRALEAGDTVPQGDTGATDPSMPAEAEAAEQTSETLISDADSETGSETEAGPNADAGPALDTEPAEADEQGTTETEPSDAVQVDAPVSAAEVTQAQAPVEPSVKTLERSPLESKIAALEEMVARQNGDFEPEPRHPAQSQDPAFVHRPADLAWTATAQPSEDTPASQPTPTGLDDSALRALVAEIIRAELQGALGERITRNVRKLVRREINRVLMSQDFD
ncbi:MAG: hypothetical protein N4A53_01175 [Pelagimonas sp.]|jgi:hypothetical protein|nr:hypothetical protein [Pelagimonas sp.]